MSLINQCQRADHAAARMGRRILPHEFGSDQVAERLRTVCVATFADQFVESTQEVGWTATPMRRFGHWHLR